MVTEDQYSATYPPKAPVVNGCDASTAESLHGGTLVSSDKDAGTPCSTPTPELEHTIPSNTMYKEGPHAHFNDGEIPIQAHSIQLVESQPPAPSTARETGEPTQPMDLDDPKAYVRTASSFRQEHQLVRQDDIRMTPEAQTGAFELRSVTGEFVQRA